MSIVYEFDASPDPGETQSICEGIDWLRMPLPFALSHINLWILRDGDSSVVVDTGIASEKSRAIWRRVLSASQFGSNVSRVVVTHLHPDHVGGAGWLCEEYDAELYMSQAEYLLCRVLVADTGRRAPNVGVEFYRAAGFPDEALSKYTEMFGMFGKFVSDLPESYRRLIDGESVSIDQSLWTVVVGRGHSPEHACLFDAERNILIAGDQLLPRISSNISVHPTEPQANPLREWLASLLTLAERLPEDVLVLPAHGRPFRGAHERLKDLHQEHMDGLGKLLDLCKESQRAIDVFPALFRARISSSNLIMATGESIAHLNYLIADNQMDVDLDPDGVAWYRSK